MKNLTLMAISFFSLYAFAANESRVCEVNAVGAAEVMFMKSLTAKNPKNMELL